MNTIKDDVLEYVNRERALLGLDELVELPCGLRGHSGECPMSRALRPAKNVPIITGVTVTRLLFVDGLRPDARNVTIQHPEYVQHFIEAFDAGHYPELIG